MLSILAVLFFGFVVLAGPQILAPEETHDFGKLVEGEVFCWDFALENVGDEELLLGPVAPSCACTSAPLARDRLAPGETLTVRVCFDSTGYGGEEVREAVSIRTNDPGRPWVRLALTGYVEPAKPYEAPAKRLFPSLYLLLDVREPGEYKKGHLLGAVNLPFPELFKFFDALPKGMPIIVYGGENAGKAVEILRSHGFLAWALAGDLEGWLANFGPLFVVGELAAQSGAGPEVPAISPKALAKNFLVILDLRPAELFRKETLPGAIPVNPKDLRELLQKLPRAEALPEGIGLTVWVVDEEGKEAGETARFLQEMGVPAFSLIGGLRNWRVRYGPAWLIPPFWGLSQGL